MHKQCCNATEVYKAKYKGPRILKIFLTMSTYRIDVCLSKLMLIRALSLLFSKINNRKLTIKFCIQPKHLPNHSDYKLEILY